MLFPWIHKHRRLEHFEVSESKGSSRNAWERVASDSEDARGNDKGIGYRGLRRCALKSSSQNGEPAAS